MKCFFYFNFRFLSFPFLITYANKDLKNYKWIIFLTNRERERSRMKEGMSM